MLKQHFVGALVVAALAAAALAGPARAQEEVPSPPHQEWSFDGVFGTYDQAALQRGFQVYKEVCSACHELKQLYFRDLTQIGYTPEEVKRIAATYTVTDGPNKQGQMFQRPGRPYDHIPGPFPNDEAARAANNGALPPDQSTLVKARDDGPDYVYAILNGYTEPPKGFKMTPGMNYNEYFPGHQIAMPKPLSPDQVKYADGTPATLPQEAHDVAAFLTWASHPNLDERHRVGFKVMLFLVVGVGVFYAGKRKIWSAIKH
jgi:ubiquinol-cytochrome c reductase cytochrome c1 subunit